MLINSHRVIKYTENCKEKSLYKDKRKRKRIRREWKMVLGTEEKSLNRFSELEAIKNHHNSFISKSSIKKNILIDMDFISYFFFLFIIFLPTFLEDDAFFMIKMPSFIRLNKS